MCVFFYFVDYGSVYCLVWFFRCVMMWTQQCVVSVGFCVTWASRDLFWSISIRARWMWRDRVLVYHRRVYRNNLAPTIFYMIDCQQKFRKNNWKILTVVVVTLVKCVCARNSVIVNKTLDCFINTWKLLWGSWHNPKFLSTIFKTTIWGSRVIKSFISFY